MAEDGDFKEKQAAIFSALIDTTRTVTQIAGEDLAFHRSCDPSIGSLLDNQGSRLLALAQSLVKISTSKTEVTAPQLRDVDSVEDNWKGIIDVIDNLLEKADASLDEYTGVIKKLEPAQEVQSSKSVPSTKRQSLTRNFRTQEIAKPQLQFNKIPKNDEKGPFKPLLRSKPHAIIPLEESLTLVRTPNGPDQYGHPYQVEITNSNYPAAVYAKSEPTPYLPFESTQATLVDTPEAMIAMLRELKQAKEIAVDLEHHDAHSFVGLVCLMQISTRKKDWIIDTLKPWREDLQILNEVFTDPNIVKVLHGAYMDMIWLQRDLGLYVVGLFDTFHASCCIGYPRNGLAALLKRFVNFDADKKYQMADWRIRPLPTEMFNYARSDTHFLLFIYDNMRNELLERSNKSLENGDLIHEVLKRSKAEALQRYERSVYDEKNGLGPGGWYNTLSRMPNQLDKEQFAVFRAVHQWRDRVARTEDEGITQVMSKQVLYDIARNMPMETVSLLRHWHSLSATFRSYAGELLEVIKQAKLAGATGPEMQDVIQPFEPAHTIGQRGPFNPSSSQPQPAAKDNNGMSSNPVSHISHSLRAYKSQFWGSILEDSTSVQQQSKAQLQLKYINLAVPLPPLTAEVFETSITGENSPQSSKKIDPSARAEHQYIKERNHKDNDVFIVKQLGGSRKRKATELQDTTVTSVLQTTSEEISGEDPDDREKSGAYLEKPLEERVNQPMSKKARKRQRKLEREEAQRMNYGSKEVENQAFDYANAPSVLHPKISKKDRAGAKKSFDPYVKSLNGPRGMRKSKQEVGGKSLTFRK